MKTVGKVILTLQQAMMALVGVEV